MNAKRIEIAAELNALGLKVRCENNTLQSWLFENSIRKHAGKEPTTSQTAIEAQQEQVAKLNGRIVELTLQLAQ